MSIKFDRCVFGCSSASLKLLLWASKSVSCHHCRRLAPGGFLLPGGFQYQYLIHLNSLYIYPVWKWLARMLWRLPCRPWTCWSFSHGVCSPASRISSTRMGHRCWYREGSAHCSRKRCLAQDLGEIWWDVIKPPEKPPEKPMGFWWILDCLILVLDSRLWDTLGTRHCFDLFWLFISLHLVYISGLYIWFY